MNRVGDFSLARQEITLRLTRLAQRTQGMTASGAQSSRFRLAMYDNIAGSVRSYMRNLNTHPSYEELRSLRAHARAENGPIRGNVLADGLRSYSTRGEEYVADVQRMIRGNALEELDGEER